MIRPGIRRFLRLPVRRDEIAEQDLDDEIRLHLELRAEQLRSSGLDASEAHAEAVRRFGSEETTRATLVRAVRRRERRLRASERFDDAVRDARFAVRSLARTPGLSVVTILALALGVGLCVSMYSVVRNVIIDPAPFPDGSRLMSLQLAAGGVSNPSYAEFGEWRKRLDGVAGLAAFTLGPRRIGHERGTVEAFSVRVTGEFFDVLRARPYLGRTLLPVDGSPSAEPAAVISHRLWHSLFAADSSVIGRTIRVGDRPVVLAGVLAPGHEFPAPVDVWTTLDPAAGGGDAVHVTVIGRRAPDVTTDFLRAAVQALPVARGDADLPNGAPRVEVMPLTGTANESAGLMALLLAISVGSILLIGVANASGLVLTRSLARGHELAVRASLGAGRGRIANLLFTEAVLLALAAAVVGLFIAHGVTAAFRLGVPEAVSRQLLGWQQLGVDGRAAAFGVAIALAAGAVCGLVPVFGASRPDIARVLNRHGSGSTADRGRQRLARALVTAEVATAVTLLLCAGLLTRSVLQLLDLEPGYRTADVAAMSWAAPDGVRDVEADIIRVQGAIIERAAAAPGVAAAAVASTLPATRPGFAVSRAYETSDGGPGGGRARWTAVSAGYFDVLDIPVRGRSFTPGDDTRAPRVAIVSESLTTRHWPDVSSALGRRIAAGAVEWTIVGVTGDVRNAADRDASMLAIYVPQDQAPTASGALLLRLSAPTAVATRGIRDEIWRADAGIALGSAQSLDDVIEELVADQRIIARVVAAYAATALIITLISLHAVVVHMVVRRRREFGIRTALGAAPRRILLTAMRRALAAALVGTVVGTVLAAGLARVIASLLHGVTPLDPAVFAVLPLLLAFVFGAAVYVPARAATKVDPIATLRT